MILGDRNQVNIALDLNVLSLIKYLESNKFLSALPGIIPEQRTRG